MKKNRNDQIQRLLKKDMNSTYACESVECTQVHGLCTRFIYGDTKCYVR